MRFLIDENVRQSVITFLRAHGYAVIAVAEIAIGLDDRSILQRAVRDRRILITNDTDFGELIYHHSLPHRGVVLFRLHVETRERVIAVLSALLSSYAPSLPQHFIVVEDDRIRIRS